MSDYGADRAPKTHHQEVYDMTIVRRASTRTTARAGV
jgi:hypothetical protein